MADEINNCEELRSAIQSWDGKDKGRQRYLLKRAIDLGCVEHVPDDWGVKVDG
jgi:hypothetical protein